MPQPLTRHSPLTIRDSYGGKHTMSELITNRLVHNDIRLQLLTTVSALAICGSIYTGDAAHARDTDHPTVWIELGGQFERVESEQDAFLPPFLTAEPRPGFETESPASRQRPPRYALGGEAKFVLAPNDSDWLFSAAIRFGRSNNGRHLHQQTTQRVQPGGLNFAGTAPLYANLTAFGDTDTAHAESHAIADFMVGRDVGVGLWGRGASSVFSFGVRFAQFTSRNANTLRTRSVHEPLSDRILSRQTQIQNQHPSPQLLCAG